MIIYFGWMKKKQITSITFADISKAIDKVWTKMLILKLEKYGIKGNLLFWLKVFFQDENKSSY